MFRIPRSFGNGTIENLTNFATERGRRVRFCEEGNAGIPLIRATLEA